MPQRALITGVTGFAGGFLAEHLLDAGDTVLGIAPGARWPDWASRALRAQVPLVAWDLARMDEPPAAERRRLADFDPSHVYHLAALSVPAECGDTEPTAAAWAVNVEGTRRILHWCGGLTSRPRVLVVSSSHVYAPVEPDAAVVSEDAPLGPRYGYGRSKLEAERVALRLGADGCPVIVVRAFNHSGPRQVDRMMLPQWARQYAEGGEGPLRVHTLDAWMDLCDVRDVVRGYRLLAERGALQGVYNLGSGVARRSGDVLALLARLARSQRRVIELAPGRKSHPIADTTRLRHATGWQPLIPLEQTVADTLAWWRAAAQ